GDVAEVADASQRWRAAGGAPAEVLAWRALTLSNYQLDDPGRPVLIQLKEALDRRQELKRSTVQKVANRLIGTLSLSGAEDEALRLYDELAPVYDLQFSREEILREFDPQAAGGEGALPGSLRFLIPARLAEDSRLWISADSDLPPDAPLEPHGLTRTEAGGEVRVERAPGEAPVRWVLREGGESRALTLASGAVWPRSGEEIAVRVEVRGPEDRARQALTAPRAQPPGAFRPWGGPADGRRRVLAVVLDCADWRLLRYLDARGDLPAIGSFLDQGVTGVLESRPAFTAAALDSLVFPEKSGTRSPLGAIHHLGVELAGLSFIGDNPFAALEWVLPERRSLFEAVGAGPQVAVNLLFSSGAVQGGRHGVQIGPGGREGRFTGWRKRRLLRPEEKELIGAVAGRSGTSPVAWLEEAAADLDAAEQIVEAGEVDLLVMRVATLDSATHQSYSEISRTAQDDGEPWLFGFYRYLDRRLGALYKLLDEDDVLLVLSDHGILTSMEHSPWAVLIAVGGEIEPGRISGTPHFRGLPRLLADLMGVETEWPATGLEAWAAGL
ncbi:MAG: alkaline phosphatase family protein, partial [Acidobacteriota bacterium]